MDATITLRPIRAGDEPFLYQVYASTREEELSRVNWDRSQKDQFLQMQFWAQHRYYQEHFPDASYEIILVDGMPAGRLYTEARQSEIRIIDIALLPAFRNQGLGSAFLESIIARAESVELPVRIHVEQNNPALRLYNRLGFQSINEHGIYYLMERPPSLLHGNRDDA